MPPKIRVVGQPRMDFPWLAVAPIRIPDLFARLAPGHFIGVAAVAAEPQGA
ncbi:hypothetical protein D3C76_1874090 [compost metagenome]